MLHNRESLVCLVLFALSAHEVGASPDLAPGKHEGLHGHDAHDLQHEHHNEFAGAVHTETAHEEPGRAEQKVSTTNPPAKMVSCGAHQAPNCAGCPQGNGATWCNGDCEWHKQTSKCVPKGTSSCRDDNDECQAWAAYGECEKNPGYMHSGCRLSCGLCDKDHGLPRSPPMKVQQSFMRKFRSEAEPGPEAAYTGMVRNLVGTTFKNATMNPDKDVFVNCFAPWCGHCQRFKPQWGKLARMLNHVKTLDIVQIDATQNDIDGPPVYGYPTVMFFPAAPHKEKITFYNGDREPEVMRKWLHSRATHAFSDDPPPTEKPAEESEGLLSDDEAAADL